jgi:hypothetical protein
MSKGIGIIFTRMEEEFLLKEGVFKSYETIMHFKLPVYSYQNLQYHAVRIVSKKVRDKSMF